MSRISLVGVAVVGALALGGELARVPAATLAPFDLRAHAFALGVSGLG